MKKRNKSKIRKWDETRGVTEVEDSDDEMRRKRSVLKKLQDKPTSKRVRVVNGCPANCELERY